VKEHASKDPLVSDALGALGYDTFLRDACRTLEAAHTKSAKPCALIDASGLRRECRSTLAIVTGDPDMCPQPADDAPRLGREPTCLAAASGDARLCAAENGERRARCEAITTRDEGRCGRSGVGKGACVRDVARWKSAIAVSPGTDAPFKVGAQVMVSSADRMFDAGRIDVDLRSLAAVGVVLVRELRSEVSCEVGVAHESGAAPLAPSPEMGTRLAFAFVVAKDGKMRALAGGGEPNALGTVRGAFSDGMGDAARFNAPQGITADANGNVYLTDTGNHCIRKITARGMVSTLAGDPAHAGSRDGPAKAATFSAPRGIAIDVNGDLLVADSLVGIRRVTRSGNVLTLPFPVNSPLDITVLEGAYGVLFYAVSDIEGLVVISPNGAYGRYALDNLQVKNSRGTAGGT